MVLRKAGRPDSRLLLCRCLGQARRMPEGLETRREFRCSAYPIISPCRADGSPMQTSPKPARTSAKITPPTQMGRPARAAASGSAPGSLPAAAVTPTGCTTSARDRTWIYAGGADRRASLTRRRSAGRLLTWVSGACEEVRGGKGFRRRANCAAPNRRIRRSTASRRPLSAQRTRRDRDRSSQCNE